MKKHEAAHEAHEGEGLSRAHPMSETLGRFRFIATQGAAQLLALSELLEPVRTIRVEVAAPCLAHGSLPSRRSCHHLARPAFVLGRPPPQRRFS
jgi:hypothetical protein